MKNTDYLNRLRNWLGLLGILLPVLSLLFGLAFGRSFNPAGCFASISATHYSAQYLLFEGLVLGTGLFLLCYEGYDIKDRWLCVLAGSGAIILSLFPTDLIGAETRNFLMLPQSVTNPIHLFGAFLFFGCLVFIIGVQFVKTSEGCTVKPGTPKWKRNILYRTCAIVMAVSLIIGFTMPLINDWGYWVYAGEWIALWAFGLAWLVKGGALPLFRV